MPEDGVEITLLRKSWPKTGLIQDNRNCLAGSMPIPQGEQNTISSSEPAGEHIICSLQFGPTNFLVFFKILSNQTIFPTIFLTFKSFIINHK